MPTQGNDQLSIVPVLAGGGGRFAAHVGALQAIEELGISYDSLVGVSGGSIVGALAAFGYSLAEIRQLTLETNLSSFSDPSIFSLLRTGGLSSGDSFEAWVNELLQGMTFAELDFDFYVVATDVRSGLPVVFSRHTHPDTLVSLAVRFSMSVPILLSFKEYGEHLMVDGSILSEEALQRDWAGDGTPVAVFKLRSSAGGRRRPKKASMLPLRDYLELLVQTFMTTLSREYINEAFWLSTIVIETGDTSPFDLKLGLAEKERLFTVGYDTTRDVLPGKLQRRGMVRSGRAGSGLAL